MPIENHYYFLNVPNNGLAFERNVPNNFDGPLEVAGSANGNGFAEQQMPATIDMATEWPDLAPLKIENDGETDGLNMDVEYDEDDIPLLGFHPIEDNNESKMDHNAAATSSSNDHQHRHQIDGMKMRPKRKITKRAVCSCCGFEQYHQKLFVRMTDDRLQVDNTLFKCTHCNLKFTKFAYLSTHMTKSHKNDKKKAQRWFNCSRCMRRFAHENDRKWHELGCRNRRYECHLCKVYVTSDKIHMQNHLRTHSGAKPFRCTECRKFFGSKNYLVRHIAFHRRKRL